MPLTNRSELEKKAIELFLLPKMCIKAVITLEACTLPKVTASYYDGMGMPGEVRYVDYVIEDGMMADVTHGKPYGD